MNKRKLNIVSYAFIILLIFTISASAEWRTFSSKDEMTGETTWYAHSSQVTSTEEMDFPYHDTKAWLGVGTDGDDEWTYIGFSNEPNISDDETQDGYSVIRTRVKWDDKIEQMTFTQEWGAKFIHFRHKKIAISKIEASNTVLVELNWYGEGKVYFRFPLNGSAAAIEKIRNAI
jgi:hypothetical protein